MKIHLLIQSTQSNGQATRWIGRADLRQTVAVMPAQAHQKLSVEVRSFPDDGASKPPATRRLTARRVGDDLVLEWGDQDVLRVVDFYRTPGAELGELELSQAAPGAKWAGPLAGQSGTQTQVLDSIGERTAGSPGASVEGGAGATTTGAEVTLVPLPVTHLLPGILGLAGLAAVGSGGSGSENVSQGSTPAVFIVRFDAAASTVSFEGAVTGDITVDVNAGSASFVRGGVTAETTVSDLFNLASAPLIKLASGQNLIVKGADIHNQSIRVDGGSNAHVTIRATDAGPTETTQLSAVVKVSLKGGTLTFDMTDDHQDTFTLLAQSAIDLAGGTLVVSDGVLDARNVSLTQLTNIGDIILNSELVVTLTQFGGLYEELNVAKSKGDLVLAIAPSEVTKAETVTMLNNIRAGAITKTTVSMEALTSDGASAVATALVQKLAPTATVVLTDTGVQHLDKVEALQATLGTDRTLDISKLGALEGSATQIEQLFSGTQVTGLENKPVIVLETQSLSVDAVNALAQRTGGRVTATISTGLMGELAALEASSGTAHAYKITLTETEVDALALKTLYGKTSEAVNAESVRTLTGSAADIVAVYQSSGEVTELGNEAVRVTGVINAATANSIAGLTDGVVTATVTAGTAKTLLAELKVATAKDAFSLTVSAGEGATAAADLIALTGKTSVAVDAKAVTAVTGTADQIAALYGLLSTDIFGLGNEAVSVSDEVSAATANSIAGLTDGVVTATVTADTAKTLLAELKVATAKDAFSLTVLNDENGTAAADLIALTGKTSVAVDAKAVTAVTGNADQIAALYALTATDISGLGKEAVIVSDEVSAATANSIAGLIEGVVTATVTAGTAANLKAVLTGETGADALTLTVLDGTGPTAAADLIALADKTSLAVNAEAVTNLSGTAEQIQALYDRKVVAITQRESAATDGEVANASAATGIAGLGDEKVLVTDDSVAAATASAIAGLTEGAVTATVDAATATHLLKALRAATVNDAFSLKVLDDEAGTNAVDLTALLSKTSVQVNAHAVMALKGSGEAIHAVYQSMSQLGGLGKETVTVLGSTDAITANAIAQSTTGAVTATVEAATAAQLVDALITENVKLSLALTVSAGAAAAADLITLAGKTSVALDAKAVTAVTGNAEQVKALYGLLSKDIFGLGNEAVSVSDEVSAATANSIAGLTEGVVTATVAADTAENLKAALTGETGADALTLTVSDRTGPTATTDLIALAGKTTVAVNALKVTSLSGASTHVAEVLTSTKITTSDTTNSIDVSITDTTITVAQANGLNADAAVDQITATISTGLMGELATLEASNGTAHAYKITLTETEVDATALKTLYGKTSEAVNADLVTTLTGSAADIVAVYQSSGEVTGLGKEVVSVSDVISAADAAAIAARTSGQVTATVDLNLGAGTFDEKVTALLDALTPSGSTGPERNTFVFRHLPSDASTESLEKLQSLSSLVIDHTRPSLNITTTIGAENTAKGDVTYVFSFDEAVVDFDKNDIAVLNGEMGQFTAATVGEFANRMFNLVVKPTANTQDKFIQLTVGTDWSDLAGNAPAVVSTAPLQPFDTLAPGLKITSDYDTLNGDEEAQVTFTFQFTESVSDFEKSDIDVVGGTLGALTGSGTTYTAIFTPEANFEGIARISVAAGGFTDTAGNANTVAASHTLGVDTRDPTLSISNDQAPGSTSKGQVTYTFTFSEAVSGFDMDDITVKGGTPLELVSTTTGPSAGKVYTLVVVPPTNTAEGILEVSVGNGWHDAFGNRPANARTRAASQAYDTLPPAGTMGSLKVTADNTVNSDESRQDTLTVTGQVTGEFTVGNSIFITVNGQTYQDVVDDTDGNFSVNVAIGDLLDATTGTGRNLSAKAVLTDAAGNRFTTPEVTHSFALDQQAPEINSAGTTFIRERAGSSVFYTATHSAPDFDRWALVSGLGDDAGLLQVNPLNGQVTLQGGGDLIYGQNDSQYKFTVRAFDKAGNHSDQAVTVKVLDLPEFSLTKVQVGGADNIINASESSGDTVRVTAIIVGDIGSRTTYTVESTTASLEVNYGETIYGSIEGNTVVFDVPKYLVLEGTLASVSLTLSIQDALSAPRLHSVAAEPVEQFYIVDIALTGAVVDVKVAGDNIVNLEEFSVRSGDELTDTLTVTGRVTGEFAANDQVTVSVGGGNYKGRVDEEGRFSIDALKIDVRGDDDRLITVRVERHDAAGNVGTTGSEHAYTIEIEPPLVTLNRLDANPVGNPRPIVSGQVTGLPEGSVTVLLTVYDSDGKALGGISVTTDEDGNFSQELFELPAAGSYKVVASTTATDDAGNPAVSGEVTAIYSPVTISTTGGAYGFTSAVNENTTDWQLNLVPSGGAAGATYKLQMEIDPSKSPDLSKFILIDNKLTFIGSTDYESFGSADGDNTYQITLHADDGKTNTVDQVVYFSLNNLGPVFQPFTVPVVALTSSHTTGSVTLTPNDLSEAKTFYHLDTASNANAGWTVWGDGGNVPLANFILTNAELPGFLADTRSAYNLLTFRTVGTGTGLELQYELNPLAGGYHALGAGESLSVPITLWVNTTESGDANGEVTRLQVPVLLRGVNDAPTVVNLDVPGETLALDPSTFTFEEVAKGVAAFDWDDSTAVNWTADIAYFQVTAVLSGTLFVNDDSYAVEAVLPTDGLRIYRDANARWQKAEGSPENGHVGAFKVIAVDRQGAVSEEATVHMEVQGPNATFNVVGVEDRSVKEDDDTNIFASGTLLVVDTDGEATFQPPVTDALEGVYGNFGFKETTGEWSYELNFGDPDTNALYEGQEVYDNLAVYSADGSSYIIQVKVTGSNDVATINHIGTPDLVAKKGDATSRTAGGTLSVSDPDLGQSAFQSVADPDLIRTYGRFTFDSTTGAWTYALDESLDATRDLPSGANESDTLTVRSKDGGTFNIDVSVKTSIAPVNTVPTVATDEDTPVAITRLSVTDEDFDPDVESTYTVVLTVTNGSLSINTTVSNGLGAAVLDSDGQVIQGVGFFDEGRFVVLVGTLGAINTTLSDGDVTFHPAEHFFSTEEKSAIFTMTSNDGAGGISTSDQVAITVNAVNDPPTNTMPAPFSVQEESSNQFVSDLAIADLDSSGEFTVTLSVSSGTLNVVEDIGGKASAYASGNGTGTVTLQGTLDKINATLADLGGVQFTPTSNFVGIAMLVMTTMDSGGASASSEVAITVVNVNDLPTGVPTISYDPAVTGARPNKGQVLTADTNAIRDEDGLGAFSFVWFRNGKAISDAKGETYTLGDADVGQTIKVRVSYEDRGGKSESVESVESVVNSAPTTAAGPVSVNGTEDTVVVMTLADIRTALGAADTDGSITQFTVGSVGRTTVSSVTYFSTLKIGATKETATAFTSDNATIDANHNAYWTPVANFNNSGKFNSNTAGTTLSDMFTVRAVDNDGAMSSSLVQLKINLAPVNDAPRIVNAVITDYSGASYDPAQDEFIEVVDDFGVVKPFLISGGGHLFDFASLLDQENNLVSTMKITCTRGWDSANDRFVYTDFDSSGNPDTGLDFFSKFTMVQDGSGSLIITAIPGGTTNTIGATVNAMSAIATRILLVSALGAQEGDRVFSLELTDIPSGGTSPVTGIYTNFNGTPFVVKVAASDAPTSSAEASSAALAQPEGLVDSLGHMGASPSAEADGSDPLAGLLQSTSGYVLSGTTESFAIFSAADAAQFGHGGQAFTDGNGGGTDVFAYNLTTGAIGLVNHSAAAGHLASSASAVSNVTLSGKHVFFNAADATQFGNGDKAFADQDTAVSDLFAYNLETGALQLISSTGDGQTAPGGHSGASFAGSDGTYAFFTVLNAAPNSFSDATSTTTDDLYRVLLV